MKEPTIPCPIIVGGARFDAGVKVSTVQGSVDRLWQRYAALDQIVSKVEVFKARLPADRRAELESMCPLGSAAYLNRR